MKRSSSPRAARRWRPHSRPADDVLAVFLPYSTPRGKHGSAAEFPPHSQAGMISETQPALERLFATAASPLGG
ncbi:hypothetical protein [Nitrobacter sp. JJSN]|uniref:hypothetical protein n=1 Tax=Nitrobacter sp. JJSN TaxID=3453033 RepID=UPI003F775696